MKNAVLLLASLLFYAYGEPVYIGLLLASSFINYLFAVALEHTKKRGVMAAAVVFNLSLLIIFKYAGFLVSCVNGIAGTAFPVPVIKLPIGISFYTFQAMSYVIDVYRGNVRAQKNFGRVFLYIALFPQLVAGPIVKYRDVEQELGDRCQTVTDTAQGLRRFAAGLAKKVLLANQLGIAADTLFAAELSKINISAAWLGAFSYMMQIYFDFSGYSDMAIGLGRMFGFHFAENFRYPYSSASLREFWRRWHISLSSWFRDYLYIPLGGNRKGTGRTMLNRFIVFLCTGIWHGANVTFLFWGAYHGIFITAETLLSKQKKVFCQGKIWKFLSHVYTLMVVCVGFVFFRADTLTAGMYWVKEMFTGFHFEPATVSLLLQQLTPLFLTVLAAAAVASMPVKDKLKRLPFYEGLSYLSSIAGLAASILLLAGGTYNPFIYFQF